MFSKAHLREFVYQLCHIERKKIPIKHYSTKFCSN